MKTAVTILALTALLATVYDRSTDGRAQTAPDTGATGQPLEVRHLLRVRSATGDADGTDGRDQERQAVHAVPALARLPERAPTALTGTPPRVQIGQPAFYSARCHDAYQAVRWYRTRYDEYRFIMGMSAAPRLETGMACPRIRERAQYWIGAAKTNRIAAAVWKRTLHNHKNWPAAVHEVQRAFPGTESWLLSCSAAESRWGAWVRYGGSPYYEGYEYTNEVGGFLQYRWYTFKGHYRHGLESLRSRGFRTSLPGPDDVRAWLSPLGQAIAGGWARWSGNDNQHWSASWGNGC